ncbi:hypothetical protein [Eubacterium oxidoreducens]|uniref:Uncharacterized protein n=1 Tax=Eubacterium oxidoreducens TaxID=1732 RepID=A0A1G6B2W0_EUBOX|nr:hypothetical protein [Eubacterium oxidoreducens]SDB14879.1 hypothetical protein SAMN02910417_01088 [Eubacterium oxidoreducens]
MLLVRTLKSRDELKQTLVSLCEFDDDVNGKNGKIWSCARKEGYSTTAEYLADEVLKSEPKTILDAVNLFLSEWVDKVYYYGGFNAQTIVIHDVTVVCVEIKD